MQRALVKLQMVHRLTHSHNLYAEENATVYRYIVEVILGKQYATTIAPFNHSGNGRGAYIALKAQFAGPVSQDQEQL